MGPLGVFGLGIQELLLILLILVLLFGARKIPELARGLGEGIRNFRAGVRERDDDKQGEKEREASGGGPER